MRGLAPAGTAVLNADDPRVLAMRSLTNGQVLTFGRAEHADVRVLYLMLDRLGRPSFTLRTADASAPVTLPLVGAHQALNASAAAAAGLAAGVPLDVAATALATASLSKWRMELRDLAGGAPCSTTPTTPTPTRPAPPLTRWRRSKAAAASPCSARCANSATHSAAEHRAIGRYAATRADVVLTIGEAARP